MQARNRSRRQQGSSAGLSPGLAPAQFQRGLALHRAGRLGAAVHAYTAAVRLAPDHGEAFHNLGMALAASGRDTEAIAAWDQAVRLRPDQADSAVALGQALLDMARHADAAAMLSAASRRHPGNARLLALNGRALLALGQPGPALGALFLSLELEPSATAHAALGSALLEKGDVPQAMHHSLAAFRLVPDAAHACTLSCVLIALGRYAEALALADHALELDPDRYEALVNRAIALEGLGRWDDAVAAGQRTVTAAPGQPVGYLNLAVTQLSLGRMTAAVWDTYEWRLRLHGEPGWLAAVPQWQGEPAEGRTILLHAEQGLGDTLQFVRYASLVAARSGARVVLAVQAPLLRLLRTVPGVDHVVAVGGILPHFDLVCPLLSLPRLFATTLETIPPAVPYADPIVAWSDGSAKLRVGLVWAGSQGPGYDRQRSLTGADLAGLADISGVQFYSLQRHEPGREPVPAALGAIDLMDGVQDFADTAALIAGLDLVVAVDTAVAHLAATMGTPVWLLSRFRGCWRWLLDRADSPWYPSVRLLRQAQPNDWADTIAEIRAGLTGLAALPRPATGMRPIRPVPPGLRACKACDALSPVWGTVDFNKCCEDRRQATLPLTGQRVTYHRCPACALAFTGDFDGWTPDDFRSRIYNAGYADADPDFAGSRPAASAALIGTLFGEACRGLDVLDYGGGDGLLAGLLASQHGMSAEVYDPFAAGCDVLPDRTYPLVTCFEVLEHTPDPRATIRDIAGLVQADGLVVMSTLLQPEHRASVDWWYVAPRNGHVTIYSAQALRALWSEHGFQLVSHGDNLHLAFRTLPAFAQGLGVLTGGGDGPICTPSAKPSWAMSTA